MFVAFVWPTVIHLYWQDPFFIDRILWNVQIDQPVWNRRMVNNQGPVVRVWTNRTFFQLHDTPFLPPNYLDYRQRTHCCIVMMAFRIKSTLGQWSNKFGRWTGSSGSIPLRDTGDRVSRTWRAWFPQGIEQSVYIAAVEHTASSPRSSQHSDCLANRTCVSSLYWQEEKFFTDKIDCKITRSIFVQPWSWSWRSGEWTWLYCLN